MGIGVGIALLVVGLILVTGAVDVPEAVNDVVATGTVGWICLIVGRSVPSRCQWCSPSSARVRRTSWRSAGTTPERSAHGATRLRLVPTGTAAPRQLDS